MGALILIGLALLTWRSMQTWESDEAVWSSSYTLRAHANRHDALLRAGQWREAITECQWLLDAVQTGQTTRQQTADIRARCFRLY